MSLVVKHRSSMNWTSFFYSIRSITVVKTFSKLKMLCKVYFNKMLHFRAKDDGIFQRKLLDILKNLFLIFQHTVLMKILPRRTL